MSDNESVGIEKPKAKRNYVRTPARDEAIKKMREAREKSLKNKTDLNPKIEDATPIALETPKPKGKSINKQISQVIDIVEEEEEEKIIVKKKPTKKRPTVIYVESESDESEAEQIIIKKKSKSKGKKKVVESSSEEEESDEEEYEERRPIPTPIQRNFIEPNRLRFL